MKRYGTSIAVMVILLIGLVFGVAASASWSSGLDNDVRVADAAKTQAKLRERMSQDRLTASSLLWPALRKFNKSWEPYIKPFPPKADVAQSAMALLERDAQASGVGSSQKTLPPIGDYRLGTRSLRVQKLSLTATGDLLHCMAWLGAIQEHLPYSRVESLTLSGFGSTGTSLQVTVALPLNENTAAKLPAATPTEK